MVLSKTTKTKPLRGTDDTLASHLVVSSTWYEAEASFNTRETDKQDALSKMRNPEGTQSTVGVKLLNVYSATKLLRSIAV